MPAACAAWMSASRQAVRSSMGSRTKPSNTAADVEFVVAFTGGAEILLRVQGGRQGLRIAFLVQCSLLVT